ncbi:SDR family oxidoreductase [Nocardiopsis coralliicola]
MAGMEQQGITAVTGASRGIGAAVALRLARDGHDVLVGYGADADGAAAVADGVRRLGRRAVCAPVEVTDAGALDSFFAASAELGPLTGAVVNAGAVRAVGPLVELDPEDLRRDVEVNLLGPVLTCRAAAPYLVRTAGALVLVGSAASTLGRPGTYVHYAAAKAGVAALSSGLAQELAPWGVRVNCVEPGIVDTAFHHDPDRPSRAGAETPAGRPGTADEIAGAVAWLLGADASYTTGATLRVAGGV